jgi:hypothetical protein
MHGRCLGGCGGADRFELGRFNIPVPTVSVSVSVSLNLSGVTQQHVTVSVSKLMYSKVRTPG